MSEEKDFTWNDDVAAASQLPSIIKQIQDKSGREQALVLISFAKAELATGLLKKFQGGDSRVVTTVRRRVSRLIAELSPLLVAGVVQEVDQILQPTQPKTKLRTTDTGVEAYGKNLAQVQALFDTNSDFRNELIKAYNAQIDPGTPITADTIEFGKIYVSEFRGKAAFFCDMRPTSGERLQTAKITYTPPDIFRVILKPADEHRFNMSLRASQ